MTTSETTEVSESMNGAGPVSDTSGENWLPMRGHEDKYEIGDLGHVKSDNGMLRVSYPSPNGAGWIGLRGKAYRIDRLVLETFKGDAPSETHGPKHLDDDMTNNAVTNLEWEEGMAQPRKAFRGAKPRKRPKSLTKSKPAPPPPPPSRAVSDVAERRFFVSGNIEIIWNPQESWVDLSQPPKSSPLIALADVPNLIKCLEYLLEQG